MNFTIIIKNELIIPKSIAEMSLKNKMLNNKDKSQRNTCKRFHALYIYNMQS